MWKSPVDKQSYLKQRNEPEKGYRTTLNSKVPKSQKYIKKRYRARHKTPYADHVCVLQMPVVTTRKPPSPFSPQSCTKRERSLKLVKQQEKNPKVQRQEAIHRIHTPDPQNNPCPPSTVIPEVSFCQIREESSADKNFNSKSQAFSSDCCEMGPRWHPCCLLPR